MKRGPVGSLELPEDPETHVAFDAEGVVVHVHPEVLAASRAPRLSFAFGRFGRCVLILGT